MAAVRKITRPTVLSLALPWHSVNAGEVVGVAHVRRGCWQADGLLACEQLLCISASDQVGHSRLYELCARYHNSIFDPFTQDRGSCVCTVEKGQIGTAV